MHMMVIDSEDLRDSIKGSAFKWHNDGYLEMKRKWADRGRIIKNPNVNMTIVHVVEEMQYKNYR